MTYETAKKLKDAGYSQEDPRMTPVSITNENVNEILHDALMKMKRDCYIPNLSELIEACGEGFDALGKCKDDGMSKIVDGWVAVDENNVRAWGATPEEAVASLFLRLNDKKALDKTPPNKV